MLTISQKLLVFLSRAVLFLYLRLGGYRLWSSIHRFLFDKKWKDVELPRLTVKEAQEKMQSFKWIADGPKELFDAVCTPQKVQAVGFDGSSPHGNDCDEEGIWLSNVLVPDGNLIEPCFLTVTWYDQRAGKFGGHNVCLLICSDGLKYMDYHSPSAPQKKVEDVVGQVIKTYAEGSTLLVWCVSSKDLKPLEANWG